MNRLYDFNEIKSFQTLFSWLAITSLVFAWISLLFRVSLWWNEASYYTHGWAVPLLSLILLIHRTSEWKSSKGKPFHPRNIILLSTFIFFPAHMLAQPDPFWRIPLWIETISLCVLTGFFFHFSKLKIAWQAWALTSLYFLTALPWPAIIETKIIHALTQAVSHFTTQSLLLLGYPAILSQGAILVDQDMVSINQACSGIRSLQNLLSLSVFLSIYFRFDWAKFIFLALTSTICTLVFNFFRALTLSFVSLEWGPDIQVQWHNFIGNGFVFLSMLFVGMVAWLLRTHANTHDFRLIVSGENEISIHQSKKNWVFLYSFGMPLLFSFLWFSWLCPKPENFPWKIDLGSSSQAIESGIEDILQFDYGAKIKFSENLENWLEIIHFGYNQDSAAASLCSRNHPPDYCMGYTGIKIVDSKSPVTYLFNGSSLNFRHYTTPILNGKNQPNLHVFWGSFTLDSRIDSFDFTNSSILEKAQWFLSGKLSYQRKVLLVTMKGRNNLTEAKEKLISVLDKIIKPST